MTPTVRRENVVGWLVAGMIVASRNSNRLLIPSDARVAYHTRWLSSLARVKIVFWNIENNANWILAMKFLKYVFVLVLLITACTCSATEPELKPGVRLAFNASRLQGWAAPDVVDWNNDGMNDVVVGHFSGAVFVYLNRGFGKNGLVFEKVDIRRADNLVSGGKQIWAWRFNKASCVCPGPGRVSPRVFDWDKDGKKDLIVGDGRGAQTRIWRNIGTDKDPLFSTHRIQYLPPDAGVRPYHETVQPFIVDWNQDGRKDLLMGRNRGVYVYINKGTDVAPEFDFERARLGDKIRDLFPAERLSPVVVDWDGDGKIDLLVGTPRGEVWFARNVGSKNGPPEFSGYTPVLVGTAEIKAGSEARIAVADLDGDGRQDLLVGGDNGVVRFFQATHPDPIARNRYARVHRDGAVRVDLIGTDDVGRTLEYNFVTQPKSGTLFRTESSLTYKPKKGFTGRDRFTFSVTTGELHSPPAAVTIDVRPPETSPSLTTQPERRLIGVGQSTSFRVNVSGKKPYSYVWKKNGTPIPKATGPGYFIRAAKEEDSGDYSVTVENSLGTVTSRRARLTVKSFPNKTDDVPVIDIVVTSDLVEPATAGVVKITRTGNTSQPVTVYLASRPAHDPVVADINYIPIPQSITLDSGQISAEFKVEPIDDTLVNGQRVLTFLIVPNPAYRLATKLAAAKMKFHDDDCPQVSISAAADDPANTNGQRSFKITAYPPPRRDTVIAYSIGGTAIAGVDFETPPATVTIPAGQSSTSIAITPYRQVGNATKKTVVATLDQRRFTFFDFYGYLTAGGTRTASIPVEATATSLQAPNQNSVPNSPQVENLRREVAKLGWVYFTGRSGDATSDLDIFMVRPDGSDLQNITNTPELDEHSARISRAGKRMLYRRLPKSDKTWTADLTQYDVGTRAMRTWPANGALIVANADGSAAKQLGDDGEYAWASWGPNGKYIACLEEESTTLEDKKDIQRKPSQRVIIRDADTLAVIKSLPSAGILGQLAWSPDGKRIGGPANIPPGNSRLGKGYEYSLGFGRMAAVDIESGRRYSIAQFPDWSPVWASDSDGDWFQGGTPQMLHSANNYGICPAYYSTLWRSGLEGKPSKLVFAEYMKHVWSGCTSPDDKYAVFVIGSDSWPLQGKMAIVRLADTPIARGQSPLFHEVLSDLIPNLKKGPVLDLSHVREAFDPHWSRNPQ